ncbi:hypothetical protein DV735_g5961, partial [Chaetothyriales sp. CBS 134920]
MHALQSFIHGLVDKTTTLFYNNLIHSDPQTLLNTQSPAGLFDNPSWAEQGANFTRFSENRAGRPMRGTELLSWKYTNTASGICNLFILNGELVTVTEYSKTQAITSQVKVIAHMIPPPVAPLFISYIMDVMPLQTFILQLLRSDGIKPNKPATQPSYQLFKRQLFVAVRRAKVPGANTDNLDMEDNTPLQLGHSSATEQQHYSITIWDIHLLDSCTLQYYLVYLDDMSQLAAIVVDKAHVILADKQWWKPMLLVTAILRKVSYPVEFTYLSFQVMAAEPDTYFTILHDLN